MISGDVNLRDDETVLTKKSSLTTDKMVQLHPQQPKAAGVMQPQQQESQMQPKRQMHTAKQKEFFLSFADSVIKMSNNVGA
jgi:hypothetical protein